MNIGRGAWPAVLWAAVALSVPAPGRAQSSGENDFCPPCTRTCPCIVGERGSDRTEGHLLSLGANMLIGGLTAGTVRHLRGGSFRDAFGHGALGGAAVYVGKRIVVSSTPGAGFAGRQVAAVGASVSRNAGEGLAPFERLILPIGPTNLQLDLSEEAERHVSVDLLGLAGLALVAVAYNPARLDWGATLSSGSFVFDLDDSPNAQDWLARHLPGAILLRRHGAELGYPRSSILGHERVHTLQYDQAMILWSDPLERLLFSRLPRQELTRHINVGLHGLVSLGLSALIPYEYQPWEVEAHFLDRGNNGHTRHRY